MDSVEGIGKFFHSKSVYTYSWLRSSFLQLPVLTSRRGQEEVVTCSVTWHCERYKSANTLPSKSKFLSSLPGLLMLCTVVQMVHEITGRICVLVKGLVQGCLSFLKFMDTHVHSVRDLLDIKPDGVLIRSLLASRTLREWLAIVYKLPTLQVFYNNSWKSRKESVTGWFLCRPQVQRPDFEGE